MMGREEDEEDDIYDQDPLYRADDLEQFKDTPKIYPDMVTQQRNVQAPR
jgi:hypothetical protein